MTEHVPVRWGILGTANIARGAFLPGLRAAGGGIPFAVAGRDLQRTQAFASANEIEHAMEGYETLLADDRVDAVYIPLPNSLHAEWTIAALESEKVVFCEKPLTDSLASTERVVNVARERAGMLWEAFVFPFAEQASRLRSLIAENSIGDVREVQATYHFKINNRENIRLSADLGGGALMDVGCYNVRLARFVFEAEATGASTVATWAPEEVDEEMTGVVDFPGDRRLLFSCGMRRPVDTLARVIGTEGQIRLANPYHPKAADMLELYDENGELKDRFEGSSQPSFAAAIRHIHRVLWGEESPQYLAQEDALGNALAMELMTRSAHSGKYERS
ncbi:MAG: Gfo/Idh/MocA family oxidoreductase [Chloroflexota bacterium]